MVLTCPFKVKSCFTEPHYQITVKTRIKRPSPHDGPSSWLPRTGRAAAEWWWTALPRRSASTPRRRVAGLWAASPTRRPPRRTRNATPSATPNSPGVAMPGRPPQSTPRSKRASVERGSSAQSTAWRQWPRRGPSSTSPQRRSILQKPGQRERALTPTRPVTTKRPTKSLPTEHENQRF